MYLMWNKYPEYIKNTYISATKKPNNPIKKNIYIKDLNRYFSKQDTQTANRHIQRRSASINIREMEIKNTVQCQSHPLGWLLSKNKCEQKITSVGEA